MVSNTHQIQQVPTCHNSHKMDTLPRDINDLLEKVLKKPISDFQLKLGEGNNKGAGFLSDLIFMTLTHKKTSEEYHLVIKQALPTDGPASMRLLRSAFANEIHFYLTCWPILKELPGTHFQHIPRCYGADKKQDKEKIVLENLKAQGFSMYDRTQPFDLAHMEIVFKAYAEFHGLSMVYKKKNSAKEFEEMVRPLDNVWYNITKALFFPRAIQFCCETFLEGVKPELKESIGVKLEGYTKDLETVFRQSASYDGDYPVLLHGDCWSSNFMFKYNESKEITALRLIDFQTARRGSPVHDLSYSFYACASTEVLQKLDHLLQLYHNTLSSVLEMYGCAVEDIYPMRALRGEWRKYSKFGMFLSLIIWRSKLTESKDVADLNKLVDNDITELQRKRQFDMESYTRKVTEVMMNTYENDAL